MSHPQGKRVTPVELRRMFNNSTIPDLIKSGKLREELIRQGHPSPRGSGQPFCTHSQILSFWNREGKMVALCHQYKRPDGTIGGSGKPDPKRIMIEGTIYFCSK
jgi:hypothetical protein